jgi:hypothetical protein
MEVAAEREGERIREKENERKRERERERDRKREREREREREGSTMLVHAASRTVAWGGGVSAVARTRRRSVLVHPRAAVQRTACAPSETSSKPQSKEMKRTA